MTRPTFYKQSSFPQEMKANTQYLPQNRVQTTNFLSKTYQKKNPQSIIRPAKVK